MSHKDLLVPPRTYRLVRDGRSARVHIMSGEPGALKPSRQNSSLISDDTPSFNPIHFLQKHAESEGFQRIDADPPAYYLEYVKGRYVLWDGPGPKNPNRPGHRVLTMTNEGMIRSSTTYTEVVGDQPRETKMYKADGPHGDPWWTRNRTLADFDRNLYQMKNSAMDHLTLVRMADQVVVAHFQRECLSLMQMGKLEFKEPVSSDFFHLILGAVTVRYRKARRQRHHH